MAFFCVGKPKRFGFYLSHRRARRPERPTTNQIKKMKNLPTTLTEIINCASSSFRDLAVISVSVTTTWGEVIVSRDGTIRMA
jgi:hypothetical protein